MQTVIRQSGITFDVDDVTPATVPLPECRVHEATRNMVGTLECCSDYHGTAILDIRYHPLLAAVHTAFSQHRPLTLTPDTVWLTITQGVAHHMRIHGERLRPRFVAHQGRLDLVFQCRDWVEGSPENPWPEAFASWAGQIRDHVGGTVHDALVCDFSTTGPVERTASHVVMMDVFERYFHYLELCICGIPTVTLEGTPADWQHLADKAASLSVFDLDWWLAHLLPICHQFVRASRGDVDLSHWQNLCKLRKAYGGDVINGWVARLFPYLRTVAYGPCNRRNPIFETGEGFTTLVAPWGLSRVPFTWQNAATGRQRRMEAIGGLLGVTQEPRTLALRPSAGWAVRPAPKMDVILARLAAEHHTVPGTKVHTLPAVPADLAEFYHHTDGAELFGRGKSAAFCIVPARAIEPLEWGAVPDYFKESPWHGQQWFRLVWLADGSWLAINPRPEHPETLREEYRRDRQGARNWDCVAAICHSNSSTQGRVGANPIVALSFTELLERLLDSDGGPCWLSQFPGYGDAEAYTRRP